MEFITVQTLTAAINQVLPEPHAGLLAGISFGTKATLSRDLLQALIATGTLHIVALSGMNISIVASLVSKTLLRLLSRRITSLLTVLLIIGFVWFVGVSPSVIRAAIMGSLSLFAIIMGRSNWPIFSWILAVTAMLLINWSWIGDISFQLSALATLGIILFAGTKSLPAGEAGTRSTKGPQKLEKAAETSILRSTEDSPSFGHKFLAYIIGEASLSEERDHLDGLDQLGRTSPKNTLSQLPKIRFLWSFVEDDLRVTLAAQVFTIPIIFLNFHRISIISPIPNVLIGPVIGPLTILGWVTGFAGIIWYPLGLISGWISWVFLQYLIFVINVTSTLPFASVSF